MTPAEVARWAAVLGRARVERRTIQPLTDSAVLTMDDAYAVQAVVTAERLARGERVVGWKLGYTSTAMRAQMGVDQPNFGPLTDAMVLADGAVVSRSLVQPRVEPEIGVRVVEDVPAGAGPALVAACIGAPFAALEVVDSVFEGYRFRIEDNTADGSSAAQVVVGPALPAGAAADLPGVPVRMWHDGMLVGEALGAAAWGHPYRGVSWLVAQGVRLRAGDFVITGGLTAAVPLGPGDVVTARFGAVTVSVRGAQVPAVSRQAR
ncbi:MAG TPA: fumarylacetoacetate hydrolase family protein [Acidimicrobiales bacterium]|nr:fumarylacetoacetate hydrolase family protein [Acidimicrobiales bacterium]